MEIQEALAAAQINNFTEVLEKAQRIEIARAQVRAFHAKWRGAPARGQEQLHGNLGRPLSKVSRGAGGVRISETPKEVTPRSASQVDQTPTPHLSGGYLGRPIILRIIVGERHENVYGVVVPSTNLQLFPVDHT